MYFNSIPLFTPIMMQLFIDAQKIPLLSEQLRLVQLSHWTIVSALGKMQSIIERPTGKGTRSGVHPLLSTLP